VRICLVGPAGSLAEVCGNLGVSRFWEPLERPGEFGHRPAGFYACTPPELRHFQASPGKASPEGGRAAAVSLDLVCRELQAGNGQGLVTCPLNKAMISKAGYPFPGHTEFLAHRAGLAADRVCMHLAGPRLRVSLVTTHHPLRQVCDLVNREKIVRCLHLTGDLVSRMDWGPGPLGVCGLNPHAGEEGRLGNEEETVIRPAILEARQSGLRVEGPLPADTVFHRALQGEFSAVLAMYHDQGLGPLKTVHFSQAVNITLGLPWVRTSVDHGTGYDLVGTGRAGTASLDTAVRTALHLAAGQPGRMPG
jgi:4-hydroxythreonine-4-phosphate dehydrogenase